MEERKKEIRGGFLKESSGKEKTNPLILIPSPSPSSSSL